MFNSARGWELFMGICLVFLQSLCFSAIYQKHAVAKRPLKDGPKINKNISSDQKVVKLEQIGPMTPMLRDSDIINSTTHFYNRTN